MSQTNPGAGPAVAHPSTKEPQDPTKTGALKEPAPAEQMTAEALAASKWEAGLKRRVDMNKQLTEIITTVELVLEKNKDRRVRELEANHSAGIGDTSEEKRTLREQQKNIRLIKATIEARRKELKEVYHLDEVKELENKLRELKRRNKSLDKELGAVNSDLGKQKNLLEEIKEARSSVTGIETPNAPAMEKHKQDLAEIRAETHMLKEKKRDLDKELEVKHKLLVDKQKSLRELKGKLKEKKKLGDKDTSKIMGDVTEEDLERLRNEIELLQHEKRTGTEQFQMDLRAIEEQKQILLEDKHILEAALSTKSKEMRAVAVKCKEFLRVSRYRNHVVPPSARETESNQSTQTRLRTRKEAHEKKVQDIRDREEAERELIEAKLRALSALYAKGAQSKEGGLRHEDELLLAHELALGPTMSFGGKSVDAKTANFEPSRIKYLRPSEEPQPLNSVASEKGSSNKAKTGTINDPFDDMMQSQFDSKGDSKRVQSNQPNIKSSGMSFGSGVPKGALLNNKLGNQPKVLTNSTPPQANIKESNHSDPQPQSVKHDPLPLPKIVETNQSSHNSQANESKRSQADNPRPLQEDQSSKSKLGQGQPSTAVGQNSKPINSRTDLSGANSHHSRVQEHQQGDAPGNRHSRQTISPTIALSEVDSRAATKKTSPEKEEPVIEFVPINQNSKNFAPTKPASSMLEEGGHSPGGKSVSNRADNQQAATKTGGQLSSQSKGNLTQVAPDKSSAARKDPIVLGAATAGHQSKPEGPKEADTNAGFQVKQDVSASKDGQQHTKGANIQDSDYVKRTTTLKPKKIHDETVYDGEDEEELSQGTVVPVKPLINQNDSFNLLAQNVKDMNLSQFTGKPSNPKTSNGMSDPTDAQLNYSHNGSKDMRKPSSGHGSRGKVTFNDNLDPQNYSSPDRVEPNSNIKKDASKEGASNKGFINPTIADSLVYDAHKDKKPEPGIDFLGGAAQRQVTKPATILSNSEHNDSKLQPALQSSSKPSQKDSKPILSEEFLANPDAGGNGKPYTVDKPAPFKFSFKSKPKPDQP